MLTFGVGKDENMETIKGLKIGDKVVYKSYDSKKVVDNGEEYLIMPYKDILAVID